MTTDELAAVCEANKGKPWMPPRLACQEPDAAEDMILGSAVRWLAEQDDTMLGPPTSAGGKYYVGFRNSAAKEGDTLLAAVLAACKDVEAA